MYKVKIYLRWFRGVLMSRNCWQNFTQKWELNFLLNFLFQVKSLELVCKQHEEAIAEKDATIREQKVQISKHSQIAALIHDLSAGKTPNVQLWVTSSRISISENDILLLTLTNHSLIPWESHLIYRKYQTLSKKSIRRQKPIPCCSDHFVTFDRRQGINSI